MDQFSHDLTVALEETSLLNRARVSWGQRRRTRSTGNLPSAPQPTEDSSSSPTDNAAARTATNTNIDGLKTNNASLPLSDSDEKDEFLLRLPSKLFNTTATAIQRLATLESDSLNENLSPARFFKPTTRRKRKLKRISVEYDVAGSMDIDIADNSGSSCLRKRGLKTDASAYRSNNLFFCGKRKRSNRDRYHEHAEHAHTRITALQSCSMPRYNHWDEYRGIRPRSFSSTSKPHSERLLPLNKGLVSKIERIAQLQKTDTNLQEQEQLQTNLQLQQQCDEQLNEQQLQQSTESSSSQTIVNETEMETVDKQTPQLQQQQVAAAQTCITMELQDKQLEQALVHVPQQDKQTSAFGFQVRRNKKTHQQQQQQQQQQQPVHNRRVSRRRSQLQQQLQFAVDQYAMDCGELNDFLSSSSLSSSDSDNALTANGTDREGDDELTDWPGNEFVGGLGSDFKRKLTKKSQLPQIRSDDMDSGETQMLDGEDTLEMRYQPSEPINIAQRCFGFGIGSSFDSAASVTGGSANCHCSELIKDEQQEISIPMKQIESEMSGETSTNFLSSPPIGQAAQVREIRAGCRRVKGERPGFSIKTSVNERLARFLQDARQTQIRLPDIEIYEHESLINLAKLYSLQMTLENGCVVLTKTSNTTQSVNMDQQNLQGNLFLGDLKRRCYDSQSSNFLPTQHK